MNMKIMIAVLVLSIALLTTVYFYKYRTIQGFQNTPTDPHAMSFNMYYADWCPHCKTVLPEFDNFSKNGKLVINGKDVVVNKYEATKDKEKVEGKIKGFPTFLLESPDGKTVEYKGQRTPEEYLKFLNENV